MSLEGLGMKMSPRIAWILSLSLAAGAPGTLLAAPDAASVDATLPLVSLDDELQAAIAEDCAKQLEAAKAKEAAQTDETAAQNGELEAAASDVALAECGPVALGFAPAQPVNGLAAAANATRGLPSFLAGFNWKLLGWALPVPIVLALANGGGGGGGGGGTGDTSGGGDGGNGGENTPGHSHDFDQTPTYDTPTVPNTPPVNPPGQPVPEPGSVGLLLAGAGLVGFAIRRRSR
jgi:hypothetical protein